MAVSSATAQSLIDELYLMGRAIKVSLTRSEDERLLAGGLGVLVTLEEHGPCRQGDLAASMCLSPSALSRHVAELVAEELLTRHPDPTDGRATVLHITDHGRALLRRIRVKRAEVMAALLEDWGDDDAERARGTIRSLREKLTEHALRTGAGEHQPVR